MLSSIGRQSRRTPVRNIFANIAENTDDLVKKTGKVAHDIAMDVTEKSIEQGVKLGLKIGDETIKQIKNSDTNTWSRNTHMSISFTIGPVSVTLSDTIRLYD
jgi:hypothetical protein